MKRLIITAFIIVVLGFIIVTILLSSGYKVPYIHYEDTFKTKWAGMLPENRLTMREIFPITTLFFAIFLISYYFYYYWDRITLVKNEKKIRDVMTTAPITIGIGILAVVIVGFNTIASGPLFITIQITALMFGFIAILIMLWGTIHWLKMKERGYREEIDKAHKIIMFGIILFLTSFSAIIITEIMYYK